MLLLPQLATTCKTHNQDGKCRQTSNRLFPVTLLLAFILTYSVGCSTDKLGENICSAGSWMLNKNSKSANQLLNTRLLILGGNGFLGTDITDTFALAGASLVLVNRGQSYRANSTHEVNRKQVNAVLCDRKLPLVECPGILDHALQQSFDGVIDLSGFNPHLIESSAQLLQRTHALKPNGIYIYISSAAVYETRTKPENTHAQCWQERDLIASPELVSTRPNPTQYDSPAHKKQEYAWNKLKCESMLLQSRMNRTETNIFQPAPVVSLRLADVIGPGDTSSRFFNYVAWAKLHRALNFPLRVFMDSNGLEDSEPLDFVASTDVAAIVKHIVVHRHEKRWHDTTVNVASGGLTSFGHLGDRVKEEGVKKSLTLRRFLEVVAKAVGQHTAKIELVSRRYASQMSFYPSTKQGSICTDVLRNLTQGWQVTSKEPFEQVIAHTAEHMDAMLRNIVRDPKRSKHVHLLLNFSNIVGVSWHTLIDTLRGIYDVEDRIKHLTKEL